MRVCTHKRMPAWTFRAGLLAAVLCAANGCQPPAAMPVASADEPAASLQETGAVSTNNKDEANSAAKPTGQAVPQVEPPPQSPSAATAEEAGQEPGYADSIANQREVPLKQAHPFQRRVPAPEFPKGMEWLNTKPLTKADLKGKFVLLDFWTYCCINCIHILPELKKLEQEFPNQLVVIGVHSAKFETEKDAENIRQAVLRYEIDHPVVNDADHQIWDTYGVNSWPTILMLDPQGNAVWGRSGEFKAAEIREILKTAIPFYRDQKLLDERPFVLTPEAAAEEVTPLRFPGKVLADEKGGRLFISDSNHNRLVIAALDGKLLDVIGSGAIGQDDGDYQSASFNKPQGCALVGDTLYVADTENHLLRKVDLSNKKVTTLSGTGEQAAHAWPGLERAQRTGVPPKRWVGPVATTPLNSPWALWVHEQDLYIAMAGPHQIWKMPLDESMIGPYAGNGREDIVDGPLLPPVPNAMGFSSFAQPSGLSSDGTWLYVADSEGSSIRAVPFDPTGEVKTVVGTSGLEYGRLFEFGDQDGPRDRVKLQHALGVVYVDGKLYIADTYNHKIKVVDASTGDTRTLAGTGKAGSSDEPAEFHEPAGLAHAGGKLYIADTNNHLIRTLDLASGKVATLPIAGLTAPAAATEKAAALPKKPSFQGAAQEKLRALRVKPSAGKVKLAVSLIYPEGWKVNPDAPMSYWLDANKLVGPVDRTALGRTVLDQPAADFEVLVPVAGAGPDEVTVSLNYYYCQGGPQGVCKFGSVVFTVPLIVAGNGQSGPIALSHTIRE
ncbi:MAG: thioredoxin-like domain-containing protein [Pirellulaceae bacterium]